VFFQLHLLLPKIDIELKELVVPPELVVGWQPDWRLVGLLGIDVQQLQTPIAVAEQQTLQLPPLRVAVT